MSTSWSNFRNKYISILNQYNGVPDSSGKLMIPCMSAEVMKNHRKDLEEILHNIQDKYYMEKNSKNPDQTLLKKYLDLSTQVSTLYWTILDTQNSCFGFLPVPTNIPRRSEGKFSFVPKTAPESSKDNSEMKLFRNMISNGVTYSQCVMDEDEFVILSEYENFLKKQIFSVYSKNDMQVFKNIDGPMSILAYGPTGTGKSIFSKQIFHQLSKMSENPVGYIHIDDSFFTNRFSIEKGAGALLPEEKIRILFQEIKVRVGPIEIQGKTRHGIVILHIDDISRILGANESNESLASTWHTLTTGMNRKDLNGLIIVGSTTRPGRIFDYLVDDFKFKLLFSYPNINTIRRILLQEYKRIGPYLFYGKVFSDRKKSSIKDNAANAETILRENTITILEKMEEFEKMGLDFIDILSYIFESYNYSIYDIKEVITRTISESIDLRNETIKNMGTEAYWIICYMNDRVISSDVCKTTKIRRYSVSPFGYLYNLSNFTDPGKINNINYAMTLGFGISESIPEYIKQQNHNASSFESFEYYIFKTKVIDKERRTFALIPENQLSKTEPEFVKKAYKNKEVIADIKESLEKLSLRIAPAFSLTMESFIYSAGSYVKKDYIHASDLADFLNYDPTNPSSVGSIRNIEKIPKFEKMLDKIFK